MYWGKRCRFESPNVSTVKVVSLAERTRHSLRMAVMFMKYELMN